jgi:beta-glucosidase
VKDIQEIKDLIAQMTLEEKTSFCSGRDFWHLKGLERLGIPTVMVTDGPHGLRKQQGDPSQIGLADTVPATCFPTASALAATWNLELIYKIGRALAEECQEEKVGVILGPGANIKRSPLCGRNFEYFSEDPYLSGELAKNYINGVQSLGIGTSLKHFAVNNQEFRRMTINALVDERALREIYLAGFEIAVRGAQPWTVMGAYNRVNGSYVCEHSRLLGRILKQEWGHEGLVVSDWGATNQRVEALAAGLEIEMPGPNVGNNAQIASAVRDGRLEESILDRALERILNLISKTQDALAEDFSYDRDAHHSLARTAAGEGAVLLKNQEKTLPLEKNCQVALIGEMARTPRYQGAGSSLVNPSRMETIQSEMIRIAGENTIQFAPGYRENSLELDPTLIVQAVELARQADLVVICAGLPDDFEVEGLDREHMRLPESHNRLIEAVADVSSRVVVVLSNGSPVEMPWIDRVQAVLEGYLGGQAGGGAIADILYGLVNPSGKLAETFPRALEDTPSYQYFPGGPRTVEYRESLYVGYRFFDTVDREVLFPFGHGLSYTTFEYSDLELSAPQISEGDTLQVSLQIKNTGSRPGKEIIQFYVSPTAPTAFRPVKELKGFCKVDLGPGEQKKVSIDLDRRAFAFYSTELQDWQVESGIFRILVGASSRDIRSTGEVQLSSNRLEAAVAERDRLSAYVNFPTSAEISREDFEELLGRPLPENRLRKKGSYTMNTPVSDLSGSLVGRWLASYLRGQVENLVETDPDSPSALMMRSMVQSMPLRSIGIMSGGAVPRAVLEGVLTMVNGSFFKGLIAAIKASWGKGKQNSPRNS